ncbi:MAG: ATPase, T2SS/T4P/T4SS family, partial [Alphaproteobacteria bacterium]
MSAPLIFNYLNSMNDHKASDLYLTVGFAPTLRTEKGFVHLGESVLTQEEIGEILNSVLTPRQRREYDSHMELNTSLDMGKYGRYRMNVLRQRQLPALVIRRIVSTIPNFEELRLPKIMEKISLEKRGLILLTGMTGSGKSTSLAAMIDYRNEREEGHIITIEDPIEYHHDHKKSVITQR